MALILPDLLSIYDLWLQAK